MKLSRLDDGSGIAQTMTKNNAKWHKSCWLLCNNTQVDRARMRREKETSSTAAPGTPLKHRMRSSFTVTRPGESSKQLCFFCDQQIESEGHRVSTGNLDQNVRKMATELRDTKLLAKISCGDLTALDAVYHKHCLTSLYTRHRSLSRKTDQSTRDDLTPESVALAELMCYMEDCQRASHPVGSIFKLADLTKLYTQRLEQLGGDMSKKVHSTRLKEALLSKMHDLEANKNDYEVILTFKKDIADALLMASKQDQDSDAIVLMRAANIVREQIFQMKYTFNGSLDDPQYDKLPQSLVALVQMIVAGPNIQSQHDNCTDIKGAVWSLAQLLILNSIKRSRKETTKTRHNPERETALPLYLGFLLHSKTRKRDIVEEFFRNGLSVSYDRIMQLSTDLANDAVDLFEKDGVVCPSSLRHGLFTSGNLDNIDHDPSSTSARTSFHGTAISITQHCSESSQGVRRDDTQGTKSERSPAKSIKPLPESYTFVSSAVYPMENPQPTNVVGPVIPGDTILGSDATQTEWLEKVDKLLKEESPYHNISWSAHFADMQIGAHTPAITALLPVFRENAHSLAMVKHGMDLIQKATQHVNPGQVPIITMDQPLFAIGKKIQWSWPLQYGETKYLVLLGGLHIEMALLSVIGDFLSGSGWAVVMASANVVTEGRADALQKGSHTSRGQWAHQVTSAALYILKKRAYTESTESNPQNTLTFDDWTKHMETEHPQFAYWNKVLNLELLFLQFMRSQPDANFLLYVETLGKIIPWMFALDHVHYARWLTVHVIDLLQLQSRCPDVYSEFMRGHFVTTKTKRKFSAMAHDQIHEQQNAVLKGDGGIIGITENEPALHRWMVTGPEIGRLIGQYESKQTHKDTDDDRHHEQIPSLQRLFAVNVESTVESFEEMGNPFLDDTSDLVTLDSKVLMSEDVVNTVNKIEEIGNTQYQEFIEERVTGRSKSIYDPIRKNNLPLFRSGQRKRPRSSPKTVAMKNDVQLFSRLYISCQSRDGDLESFFEHENQPWPPSLAENNSMRHGNKSDLMGCLEALAPRPTNSPEVDVKIIDGAALMHILDPKKSNVAVKTFGDFSQILFVPYISRQLQSVVRLDVVWDVYKPGSLKSATRERRGTGEALRVTPSTRLPSNWKTFLRVDSNKTGLFKHLAATLKEFRPPDGKVLLTTYEENALSNIDSDVSQLAPCTHDEADGRMLLHAYHAYQHGHRRILIQATDTDVVVLAIRTASVLEGCELWVAFGHGKTFRYIAAHSMATKLGAESCQGLLFLHAFSGCDTVSSFCGIGKKTAWDVWRSSEDFRALFSRLSLTPAEISDDDMKILERYVVLMYKRTSDLQSVNEARKQLFAYGNWHIENIPPTKAALLQHVKRAAFQAGHVWGQSLVVNARTPSPADWGWEGVGDTWFPTWSHLSEASKSCRELIKCACKGNFTGRCKCKKANLPCTQLCSCGGQCGSDV